MGGINIKLTRKIAIIGMFSAIAFVLSAVGNLVPIRIAGFLSYDPKDAIIVIAGFALGPVATIAISVVVSFLEMAFISSTGIIGCLMNILSSVAFALIPALFYKKKRSFPSALVGLILGCIITTASMLLWNYFVTPHYMGVPQEVVAQMLLPTFLPFNLGKSVANSVIVVLIYKPTVKALRKMSVLE